ncbi:hypothetical protein C8R44DRAFT_756867 [Mycena epipterygia]|nr:hypothetical protein C8R44DRAFT_756867 [Mycena epipterygia]
MPLGPGVISPSFLRLLFAMSSKLSPPGILQAYQDVSNSSALGSPSLNPPKIELKIHGVVNPVIAVVDCNFPAQ